MIFITCHSLNIINEEMLYEVFRIYGKIVEIKIKKEYYELQSAIIEFADQISVHQIQVEQREFKINKSILKVQVHDDQDQDEFKTINLFVNNIPSNITQEQLSIFFEQFGPVLNCKIKKQNHTNNKSQYYCFVEYKSIQTTINLMEIYLKQPLKINGKILIIQPYKDKTETKVPIQMIIKGFCRKLNQSELYIFGIQRFIELTWELLIVNYFNSTKLQMKNCFVKMENDQPYIILVFPTLKDTIKFMKITDQLQGHPCFQQDSDCIQTIYSKYFVDSSITQTYQQFYQQNQMINEQFTYNQNQDYFNGNFSQFNCRYHFNNQDYYDDRILVISNLKQQVTIEQMKKYIQQYGLIKSLILKNEQMKDKTKVCFILSLTSYDAQLILQEYENKYVGYLQSKFDISDSPIKILKLHYKHNEYEKILNELYKEAYFKKEIQTQTNILKNKEYYQNFDQGIEQFRYFKQLSQLDQKLIESQLIQQIIVTQSKLNLVDQQKDPFKFQLEIEEAKNNIILDLNQKLIQQYSTLDDIMNNFESFYSLKDDQKINIIKYQMKQYLIKELQISDNQANQIIIEIMKKLKYKIQDLICLLEDKNEFLNILNKRD